VWNCIFAPFTDREATGALHPLPDAKTSFRFFADTILSQLWLEQQSSKRKAARRPVFFRHRVFCLWEDTIFATVPNIQRGYLKGSLRLVFGSFAGICGAFTSLCRKKSSALTGCLTTTGLGSTA
jgi:hypothetical protein